MIMKNKRHHLPAPWKNKNNNNKKKQQQQQQQQQNAN